MREIERDFQNQPFSKNENNNICTPNSKGQLAQLVADDTDDIVSTGECRHAYKQCFVSIRLLRRQRRGRWFPA
jgi:hypothetical protein